MILTYFSVSENSKTSPLLAPSGMERVVMWNSQSASRKTKRQSKNFTSSTRKKMISQSDERKRAAPEVVKNCAKSGSSESCAKETEKDKENVTYSNFDIFSEIISFCFNSTFCITARVAKLPSWSLRFSKISQGSGDQGFQKSEWGRNWA